MKYFSSELWAFLLSLLYHGAPRKQKMPRSVALCYNNYMNKKIVGMILALICIFSVAMMFWAAWSASAIVDEQAHIPAGYGYVSQLDARLNPEHPPLLKALAALPLLVINPTFPTDIAAWTTD